MGQYDLPDARGHFGPYGGVYVAETLMAALDELKAEYDWRHSDEYITDMIDANWHHDEIVSYCLENDEPVVWQSANC